MLNIKDFANPTAVKNLARKEVFDVLVKYFVETYGEDNVTVVGGAELSIVYDTIKVGNELEEVCVNIKPVSKEFMNRKTKTKTITPYDREIERDLYLTELAEKEAKRKKKVQ